MQIGSLSELKHFRLIWLGRNVNTWGKEYEELDAKLVLPYVSGLMCHRIFTR